MTGLQDGQPLSDVVRVAKASGFTEPDPRDDLNGMDVARKALILARLSGWRMELKDVAVESMVPQTMAGLDTAAFMDQLGSLDADMACRLEETAAAGCRLRYVASAKDGQLTVGLKAVGPDSALFHLRGTDNLVSVKTKWYDENDLVIQGRGAGFDATAAGVLADLLSF